MMTDEGGVAGARERVRRSMDVQRGKSLILRSQTRQLLAGICEGAGLAPGPEGTPAPDGRPLYLYPITPEAFTSLGSFLRDALQNYHDNRYRVLGTRRPAWLCALFVFHGAHWFRREGEPGHQRWANLGVLPDGFSPVERGEMVRIGLRWWGIEVFRSGHANEWLHTLALNGGIPARVLMATDGGWAGRFFDAVVSDPQAASAVGREGFLHLVESHAEHLPAGYREPEIFQQSAHLVELVAHWRRECPDGLDPQAALVWMETAFPEWKHDIPLHVGEDPAELRGLLSRLLTIETREADRGLCAVRGLEIATEDGVPVWTHTAQLSLRGRCAAADFGIGPERVGQTFALYADIVQSDGTPLRRMRVGRADVVVPKEGGPAELRCSSSGLVSLGNVPPWARIDIVAEQTGGMSFRARAPWRGTDPVLDNVLVFASRETEPPRSEEAELLGRGSVRTRSPAVWVLSRGVALKAAGEEDRVRRLGDREGWTMWHVAGRAVAADEDGALRIRTAEASDTVPALQVAPILVDGLTLSEPDRQICVAPLRVTALRNDLPASVPASALHVSGDRTQGGCQTVRWRDADGFVEAVQRVLALPLGTELRAERVPDRSGDPDVELTWSGLPGWTLHVDAPELGNRGLDGAGGHFRVSAKDRAALSLELQDPDGGVTAARLSIGQSWPGLRRSDGTCLVNEVSVDLVELDDIILDVPRSEKLEMHLKGVNVTLYQTVSEGAVRLGQYHDAVESLLAMSEVRGPVVEIGLLGGPRLARVHRPETGLQALDGLVKAREGQSGYLVFRSLVEPVREYAGGPLGPSGASVPGALAGPCLAYLRKGDRVISRPVPLQSPRRMTSSPSVRGRLALIEEMEVRRGALLNHLRAVDDASTRETLATLPDVIASLRGLSPRALDILDLLPDAPDALCHMLLGAKPERRDHVLSLENRLPFLWMAVPAKAWERAQGTLFQETLAQLSKAGLPNAAATAMKGLADLGMGLLPSAPWFAAHMKSDMGGEPEAFAPKIGPFIDLCSGLIQTPMAELFGPSGLLDHFEPLARLSHDQTPALLAPLALAGMSHGLVSPNPSQTMLIRSALVLDADFVVTGYLHAMRADIWT